MSKKIALARHPRRISPEAKAEFREQIVRTAHELFAAEGYAKVSMRALASRVGCTPMALYLYFPNKLALLRFIWADIFRTVFDLCEAAIDGMSTPTKKLLRYWEVWVDYWLRHPQNYEVVFMNRDEGSEEAIPSVDGMDQPFFANGELATKHLEKIVMIFVQGVDSGEFRDIDPKVAVEVMSTQMLGLVHGLITIPELGWSNVDQLVQISRETSVRGFLAPGRDIPSI